MTLEHSFLRPLALNTAIYNCCKEEINKMVEGAKHV